MIEEIREKIMNRQLRVVDEDCETFQYDDDIFVINFTAEEIDAETVFKLPACLETNWDKIREMIITGNFEDIEIADTEKMEMITFSAEEIKNFFGDEEAKREFARDKILDIIDEDLSQLCEIRRFSSQIFDSPVKYGQTVYSVGDYQISVLDDIEDEYWDCPEDLKGNTSRNLLEGEITRLQEEFDNSDTPDYVYTDEEFELLNQVYSLLCDNELERAVEVLETFSNTGKVKKFEEGKQVLEIDEFKFSDWLKNAWLHQHDGWNRDLWWDSEDQTFWSTTETKSTSFVNGDSVVLICHVSGDNNADYNSICDFCSSHDENYEHCCDAWEGYHESFPDDDFEDMQFDCMGNVGWTDNIKEEIEERLKENFYIEWV